MFIDPIPVAANAGVGNPAFSFGMVATSPSGMGASRRDVVNNYTLDFSHSQNANTGERHYMQIKQTVTAANPLGSGGNELVTASVSLSVSIPAFGWTAAQKKALVTALLDTLNDSDVTIDKFLQFNS
jgi:hypothetical protein